MERDSQMETAGKIAVLYYSRHHGNTRKVLEAMSQIHDMNLIDITVQPSADLSSYDLIGLASGIYYGKFHKSLLQFAQTSLPEGKEVFFVYTSGSHRKGYTSAIAKAVQGKGCQIRGEFGCLGYDTFGPFYLFGGITRGHPSEEDFAQARDFLRGLLGEQR